MLGFDSKPMESGAARARESMDSVGDQADRTGRKVEEGSKRGADGLDSMTRQAAKFLALIGGTVAIKRFVEDTIASGAALDRFSRNLGQDVSTVSAWGKAVEAGGGAAGELTNTLDMLSRAQTDLMLTGESSLIPYLSALGVSLADVGGKAREPTQVLLELADRFSRMNRTTANNMGRMMGLDQGTLNLLLKGRQEVELLIARQEEYNVVTRQQAEDAARLERTIIAGSQAFNAFGRSLMSSATPALETVFGWLAKVGEWIQENQQLVGSFLTVIAGGLLAIGAAVIPINATAAAVVGLGASIALLMEDYQKWKDGSDSLIDWSKWEVGIKAAGNGIDWLRDKMTNYLYKAMAWSDAVAAVLAGDRNAADRAFREFDQGMPQIQQEAPPGDLQSRQRDAMRYFQERGWSADQAAGIVANITRESGFNPAAVGDGGKAYGLAQWHPERRADFKARFGRDIEGASIEEQMAFIQHELTVGKESAAGAALRGATSAEDAASIISRMYERPADADVEAAVRAGIANELMGVGAPVATPGPLGYMGLPSPSAGMGMSPAAAARGGNTTEVHIGEIKVVTSATDAEGIARDIGKSLNFLFTSQANAGMV
jgi:hypothetical protein